MACGPPAAPKAAAPPTGASGGVTARSSTAADTTAPAIVSADYAGTTVTLTMSEPVWAETTPWTSDFVVRSNTVFRVTRVGVASRRADAGETITLTLNKAPTGSARVLLTYLEARTASARPRDAAGNRLVGQDVTVRPRRTLTVRFDGVGDAGVAEDAGEVAVTLALDHPPDAGSYTGCRLRLTGDSVAGAADVEFADSERTLDAAGGWRAGANLLKVVDDAYAEGDEALTVEAYCAGGGAGMDPPASGLVSEPSSVTIADNESRTIALSADPAKIPETAGATRVTVTATLDGRATEKLDLALTLAGTATAANHTVTGTRRVVIEAGTTSGSTVLTVTPTADADDLDQTVAIGSTLTGYVVTGASVAIAEPPAVVSSVASTTLSEDAGKVNIVLTLTNPPDSGGYTGCRLRLGADSEAETPADVTFSNQKKLTADNGWSASAKLLTVVDDALAEDDEALVVEGHCTGRKSGTEPAHTELVSKPLTLTIRDNDTVRALTLSVDPDTIGETLGEQKVEVTATVADAPPSPVTVSLGLGSGAYTVTGARSVTIPADAASGTATLTFTPTDDGNTSDDTLTIDGAASGYTVAGTGLTITEPVTVDGVDLSGLTVELAVSPTAIREGTSGSHRLRAKLDGVDVPAVSVAFTAVVGGTATQGASHDYTLAGTAGWDRLTVEANAAHLSDDTRVTVSALGDNADEGGETVTFTVSRVTWGTTVVALRAPAVATLTITEAWDTPRSPKGLAATPAPGNETHGLDASWKSVTATPAVEGYVVRHRPVTDPPAAWTDAEIQPGLATTLTGLNAGTRYEIRVFARNAAGDGAESGSVFAYTADGGCPMAAPAVTTPEGARAHSDLNVSWQAPACGSSLSGYRVRYREDPDVENVENDWIEIAAAGTAATLTGLTPDTAWTVAVRAVAVGGDKGPWSPAGMGRTGLDTRLPPRMGAPLVAPHAVDGASRLEATWTRVTWTDENDVVHPITEYQYRHRPDGGVAWTAETGAQATSQETTAMTRSISGLAVGTWHEVQVRAVNRMSGIAYPGKWSAPGRGRTWGAPDPVEEPWASLTGSGVEVAWDAPHDGGSPITDYDVEYKVKDSGGWDPHNYAGCSMGTCATETSIDAVARKVRVRAENALGMGEWSPAANVQSRKLLRVSYGASAATVNEGESLLVTVRLDSAADRSVSAPVTKTGDATAFRLDGLGPDETAAFGLGTTEQTFTFVALQDEDDDDEKVTLGFGTLPDGVRLREPAALVVTVRDDETANGRPSFAAGAAATRTVAENAAAGTAVGAPLTATDPEDDALTYTLSGTHAALFSVDGSSGQLEVGADADLDFEGAVTSHAVTVGVGDGKDGAGAADTAVDATIAVTVNVTDVAEPPGAPDAPALTPTATTLAVAWTAPDNTGPAITGYDVRHRASGDADWTDAAFAGTGTSTTLTGLSAGTAHEVRVRATSDEGTGDWSASAEENTLPSVSLSAGDPKPEIADGNAAVAVTLSAAAGASGGTLNGAWLERDGEGTVTVLADDIALTDGTGVTRAVSASAPGPRTFGFRATHALDGRTHTSTEWVTVDWRPRVVLSATPASVAEDGGATKIAVTATLTGTTLSDAAKTVTVAVAGGTATAGDDFEAVDGFAIAIAGSTRSADGSFTLTPLVDADREGPETVAVTGAATDGAPVTVVGATVSIVDADPKLTVTAPTNGYVTGTTGGGDAKTTVIDCGPGNRTDCSETLASGTVVTLTATADAKYLFGGWSGACTGAEACTLTLNADSTVGTTFVAARSLTVTAPSHGKVTGRIGTRTVIDCGSDCSETVADGTRVALSASPDSDYRFDGWGDACASETSAACSLTLDADRTVSVAFVSTAIVGKCDETAVDGCAAGNANTTAVPDTDSHHRWRCDGSGGGANSPTCTKRKLGCASGTRTWSAGGYSCAGSIASATSGQTKSARDMDDPTRGSAAYKCDDGAWLEQAGGTCSVDLQCGASANVCMPDGVESQARDDAPAEDGACAATEASGCLRGTYTNRDDVPLENGACGAIRNDCDGGDFASRADTAGEYRWRCIGIDAEDRWACLGVEGSKNWSCSYGNQSKACGVPVPAKDVETCGVGDVTRHASDASCSICKPGYKRHNGVCVELPACGAAEDKCDAGTWAERADTLRPATNRWYCRAAGESESCRDSAPPPNCGDNQEYALDASNELTCRCVSGHHLHGGKCVRDPMCSAPLVENECKVGTATGFTDTAVYGACEATETEGCVTPGGGAFEDAPNTPKADGKCGAKKNSCLSGTTDNEAQTTSEYTWDCLGIAGSKNWSCEGSAGRKEWGCENGDPNKTQSCGLPSPGSSQSCGEAIAAVDYLGCYVCKPGYKRHNGVCVELPACGNAEDECDAGTWAERADTLGPATNRWYCRAAGESESCRDSAPPPNCGDNEEYALDASNELTCKCESGYHMHGGKCVRDPMCSNPLVENKCEVGTPENFRNTSVHAVCETTEAKGCRPGVFHDEQDKDPVHGVCGSATNTCAPGKVANKRTQGGKNLWDCLGTDGSKNWSCLGSDGRATWNCASALQEASCAMDASGSNAPSCSEADAANHARDCFTCRTGFTKVDDTCVKFYTLTVIVEPADTGTVTGGGFNCTGVCSKKFQAGTDVGLTVTPMAGHECRFGAGKTASTVTMTSDKTAKAVCRALLEADAGGPYDAKFVRVPVPIVIGSSFYVAGVTATATGGVLPYAFKWSGKTAGASATYIWHGRPTNAQTTVSVTVTDSKEPTADTDSDDAVVNFSTVSGAQAGASDETVRFEVPVGGEVYFIWGEDSAVKARSGDSRVVRVNVSSPAIEVTGVSGGETEVVVATEAGEELWLPVVVR